MAFTLRKFAVLCKRSTYNCIQTSVNYTSNRESKSKVIQEDPVDRSTAIFKFIKNNHDFLTGQNYVEALQKLSDSVKFGKQSTSLQFKMNLLELCSELQNKCDNLNSSESVEAIDVLLKLGVPLRSQIFQSLCKNINTADLESLNSEVRYELQRLMGDMKALRMTGDMSTESKLSFRLNEKQKNIHIYSLCDSLYQATKKSSISNEDICLILHSIDTYGREIPINTAKSIFYSLANVSEVVLPQFSNLLRKTQNILISGASELNFSSILYILRSINHAIEQNETNEEFYNEELIDTLIDTCLSKNSISFNRGMEINVELKIMGHFKKSLIDYFAVRCSKDPSVIHKMNGWQLSNFTSIFTISKYKPPCLQFIQKELSKTETLNLSNLYTLTHCACNLAITNYFPHHLISKVFSISIDALIEMKHTTRKCFQLLYILVKSLDPNYDGPWPSIPNMNFSVESSKINFKMETLNLLPLIEKIFGGKRYIRSNLKTKQGHFIDHVFVMRTGGYPVAINFDEEQDQFNHRENNIKFLEDIQIPSGSQVIAILCWSSTAYLRNTRELRGPFHAYSRSLEALKYIVININITELMNLEERIRIPTVMKEIREKLPLDLMSESA